MVDFTEEQLAEIEKAKQEAVAKALAEKEVELKKQHDSEMAQMRIKAKSDQEIAVKKAKDEATLSAEELARKELEEKTQEQANEIAELRAYKKQGELTKKLVDNNLPTFFVNDSRLLNSTNENVDDVIKTIKEEYKKSLPNNGATITTNVIGSGSDNKEDNELNRFRNLGLSK